MPQPCDGDRAVATVAPEPVPPRPDWLARQRGRLEQGRDLAHLALPFAPPQVRVPLIAATLAVEGLLTYDDARSGRVRKPVAGMRGVGIALDGLGLAASSRIAPVALARQARRIATLRTVFSRVEQVHRTATRPSDRDRCP